MASEVTASEQMEITNESDPPAETTTKPSGGDQQKDESGKEVTEDTIEGSKTSQEKVNMAAGAVAASNPHYRVKISGLPRFYTPSDPLLVDFKRLLASLGLNFKYIRSPKKGNSWLHVAFYNQENQEKALKLLKNYKWKGRTLICTLVFADELKRKQEDCGQEALKKPRLDIPIEEQMLMSTIPYHSVSYEEQLSKKNEEAQGLFKWLSGCLERKTPELIGYIDKIISKNKKTQLPFRLDKVRSSPVIDGYRNKCEFRIGMEPTTKKVIVGYRVDYQEEDNIAVAPPDALRHLPKEMLEVVKIFEKFVQESPHPPQITNHDPGVWRLLHVRINKAKQLMVVVMINPTVLDEEAINTLKQQLIDYFTVGPASGINVVSLYLHTDNDVKFSERLPALGLGPVSLYKREFVLLLLYRTHGGGDKVKRPQGRLELIWGESHIEENLLDLKLEIDPNSYFPNNTWGAEELYKAVKEVAGVDKETTVLDLCCGSGGIGMMFAKDCKEVIGVEVLDVNVDDSKRIAAKNGLTNCEFMQGAVEDLFPELQEKLKEKKVVPILDPPRAGVSAMMISSLRKMKEVQRIIYVCSNHKLPSKNIKDLCLLNGENGEYKGTDPFFPTRVIPVDISPHSLRCELVILLERLDMSKIPKPLRSPMPKSRFFNYLGEWERRGSKVGSRGRGIGRGRGSFHPQPPHLRGLGRGWVPQAPIRGRRPPGGYGPPEYDDGYRNYRDTMEVEYGPPEYDDSYRNYRDTMEVEYGPPEYDDSYRNYRDTMEVEYGPPEYDDSYRNYRDTMEVEPYIPSPPPPRGNVSHRLAMANAMLERGLRLAEEAMAERSFGRPPQPVPPPPYPRRGRVANPLCGPSRSGPLGGWRASNSDSWGNGWNGNEFTIHPTRGMRGGRGSRGMGAKGFRGIRGNKSSGVWRR